MKKGDSEVEQLARHIESRRDSRIVVTFGVIRRLLDDCRKMALDRGHTVSRIHHDDLIQYRRYIENELELKTHDPIHVWKQYFGFRSQSKQMLEVVGRALEVLEENESDEWFYYMDFSHYHTVVESKWPWMRSGLMIAFSYMLFFYLFTPVLFCYILRDKNICPDDTEGRNRSYVGWVSALYFASTTLSTVGYGDLHVSTESSLNVIVGTVYMIAAQFILILFVSNVNTTNWKPLEKVNEIIMQKALGKLDGNELPFHKIRRVRMVRMGQIMLMYLFLNSVGVFAARLFVNSAANNNESWAEEWTWLTSIYWAIQTSSTIGYGDLDMGVSMRAFQIVYLLIATIVVGQAIQRLASLREEIEDITKFMAWGSREVSKGLIHELQPYEHDDKIDQYEFAMASLITLGKVSSSDLEPIMGKSTIVSFYVLG